VISGVPGRVSFRHLLGYQPVNTTINLPGTTPIWAVAPKVRQNTFLTYETDRWSVSLQNQWLSSVKLAASDNAINGNSQNYASPRLDAYDVLDVTVAMRFRPMGADGQAFLTINNITNTRAPLFPSNSGIPGLFYPTMPYYDDMGRFFTVGIKAKF